MQRWNPKTHRHERATYCSRSYCNLGPCITEQKLLDLAGVSRTTFWRHRKNLGGLTQTFCRGMYRLEEARAFLVEHYHLDADAVGQETIPLP